MLPLADESATWEEVLEGFEWLKRDMTPEDVAMVLLAGHGVNDAEGAFYFVPHDADLVEADLRQKSCIGHDYMRETFRTLADRGKTLLFLDACHSGNVLPDTQGACRPTSAPSPTTSPRRRTA